MLHRVIGRAGSGKTTYMIECLKEMQSAGVDCLFLVPEQNCMETELRLELEGAAHINTEVLNFERLPNRVFREIGGLYSGTVDATGKCVLMASAVGALGDSLSLFSRLGRGLLGDLCATVSALKRLCVSPARLMDISTEMEEKGVEAGIVAKIRETALVYGKYQALLGDTLRDDDDALTRIAQAEDGAEFFRGKAVFIDGIYTYTPQQLAVIKLMASTAAELYISFTADDSDQSGIFDGTLACMEEIKRICAIKTDDHHFNKNYRIQNPALRFGEQQSFTGGATYTGVAEGIQLIACETRYDEAQYAAKCIYDLRAKGLRYDQIAIAVRNPAMYAGVLDAVLAGYGIPFYFGAKDNAATKPLTTAMLALLEMAESNLPLLSVKKYLKTTFSVLTNDEVDSLVRYGESWDIRGKSWIGEKDWLMNPEGYRQGFSEEAEQQLQRINGYRRKLAASITPVIEMLKSKELTVGKGVSALYNHLVECGAAEKLSAAAEKLAALGDGDGAAKTAALWGVTVDIFDRLYTLVGDKPTTPAKLLMLIEAMAESTDIGALPSYTDAVNIGDARLIRAEGVKAMIILGVTEGEFPALPSKSGVFSLRESTELGDYNVALLPDIDTAVNEERFFFYNCASAPSHYLFVSHISGGGNRHSPLFKGLCRLYGVETAALFGATETDRLFCRKSALESQPYLKSKALKAALKARLCEDAETASLLLSAPPLQEASAYVAEDSVSVSYVSYSRVDCYNNCGFAYLMNYVLKLKDNRRLSFSSMDSGTYMHHLVEQYLKKRVETGTYVPADREETIAEISAISEDYITKIMPTPPKKRLKKLIQRLQNAVVYVCEDMNNEFAASNFVPAGFEVKIGTAAGNVAPPHIVSEKGVKVNISGSIDRIDTAVVEGTPYVRVVDYKSSAHSINPNDAVYGEGLQMLSYLFAYCDAKGTKPAGVLYRTLSLPEKGKSASQSGLVTDNEQVINAMGDRVKKLRGKVSDETFEELRNTVYGHIKETADRISNGNMCATPFKKREQDCKYCAYGEVCRLKKEDKGW